jgi:osmotically-inducible protein OsmY
VLATVPFLVESTLGEIRLRTPVVDPCMLDRAVEIARKVPGVVDVDAAAPS